MAITTISGLRTALAGARKMDYYKVSGSNGTGVWGSRWKDAGYPLAGSNPGALAGSIPDNTTTGAFDFSNSSSTLYMLQALHLNSNINNKTMVYDRLWHNSEMSGTTTVDTTIGTMPALTRPDANGDNTELWIEIYSTIGTTASTLSVKYTNPAGTTGQTATYVKAAGALASPQNFQMTLASGDTGVKSVQSYSWSTTTGTAGNFGLIILRRICILDAMDADFIYERPINWAYLGMPQVNNSACIAMMTLTSSNAITGNLSGTFWLGQG